MPFDPTGGEIGGISASSAETRTRVLAAALDCFSELGYGATRINHIQRRSGVSVGSIYHHFGTKDGVALALYDECLTAYRSGLLATVEAADGAEALIRDAIAWQLDWAAADPARMRFLLGMQRDEPLARADGVTRQSNAAFLRALFALLLPYMAAGQIASLPPAVLAAQIVGPAQELIRYWLAASDQVDLGAARDALAAAAWRALCDPAASPEEPAHVS